MSPRPVIEAHLTLARAVYGFVIVAIISVALVSGILLSARSSTLLASSQDQAVRVRTEAAGQALAQSLHNDWADLKYLASATPDNSGQSTTRLMDGMRGDAERISWIGYADLNGQVLNASGDLLVGADVSARPWFINGLKGPYAGDVHAAVLLSKILAADDPADLRFVDFAMPVRNDSGQITGVVAVHINFAWAQRYLKEQAETLGLTLFLSSATGDVIMSTNDTTPTQDEVRILRDAPSGAEAASMEVWPDGKGYFASLVPQVTYRDMPNFGWRLVGRLDGTSFTASLGWLTGEGAAAAAGLICLLGMITVVFVFAFIRPIERLGQAAEQIADGQKIYPPDLTRTREMSQLSAALARFQSSQGVWTPKGG